MFEDVALRTPGMEMQEAEHIGLNRSALEEFQPCEVGGKVDRQYIVQPMLRRLGQHETEGTLRIVLAHQDHRTEEDAPLELPAVEEQMPL